MKISKYKKWSSKKVFIWKAIIIAKLTNTQIVDIFSVTRQYVSLIRKEMEKSLND